MRPVLRRIDAADAARVRSPAVAPEVLSRVSEIATAVRDRGESALRKYAERWDRLPPGAPLLRTPDELKQALNSLPAAQRELLRRAADRIAHFARAQLETTGPARTEVPGGWAGDRLVPVRTAGCYAPGGRFPLPSSVLMTAVVARVAGVRAVWLASPDPSPQVMAAASVAGVDGLLAAGGAQAVAALAYGVPPAPRCDVVAGPGNQWVTGAKLVLSGVVGIDLLAGPSELVVLADQDADPALVAADLLAQAEHDVAALPVLVTPCRALADRVDAELASQLPGLPTEATAAAALRNGFAVVAPEEDALRCCQELAPEHLAIHGARAERWAESLDAYGAVFVGADAAEVLGDYGIGPNHTLPTGGTARFHGGLSVFSFLRRPSWVRLAPGPGLERAVQDAAALARMEGLEAHARSAERRSAALRGLAKTVG